MPPRPPRLVWKFEDGPVDVEGPDDRDIGPAWIDTFAERDDAPISSHPVDDGEWITRAEARELAAKNGYELVEDG